MQRNSLASFSGKWNHREHCSRIMHLSRRYLVTTPDPGARLVLTQGFTCQTSNTILRGFEQTATTPDTGESKNHSYANIFWWEPVLHQSPQWYHKKLKKTMSFPNEINQYFQNSTRKSTNLQSKFSCFFGNQSCTKHDTWVGRVGATRDGSNDNAAMSQFRRLTFKREFDNLVLLILRNSKALKKTKPQNCQVYEISIIHEPIHQ